MMPLLTGLATAMLRLSGLGLAPGVPLQSVQYTLKGSERIPIPGANENVGIANLADYLLVPGSSLEPIFDGGQPLPGTDMTTTGYPVNDGTSFLLTMAYTGPGPVAKGVLTFGESADPASPHFADQTRLFSRKQLRDCLFSEASIAADPELTIKVVTQG
jgi:acyl-homoserine-lactone acylase